MIAGLFLIASSRTFIFEITKPSTLAQQKCGDYDTSASRGAGAAYAWCKPALKKYSNSNNVALSFGVWSWDQWSRTLTNSYFIKTALFDCFAEKSMFESFAKGYVLPYQRYNVCLGPELSNTDNHLFLDWKSTLQLIDPIHTAEPSLIVKFDIEGSEWEVLETMSDAHLANILLFDLEIHFCIPKHGSKRSNDYMLRIQRQLLRLDRIFYVAQRFADEPLIFPACLTDPTVKLSGTTMMSISYINKAFVNQ